MTPELRIVLALGFVWAFATGIIVGRRSRERELNRLTDNERFARECTDNALRARDAMAEELYKERSRRKFLENVAGMRDGKGRQVWN